MAKYKFSQSQFEAIGLLLKRRQTESGADKKKSRAKIRKLGFMISDYFNGFTDLDFKKLLDKGDIQLVGKKIPDMTQIAKKPILNEGILQQKNSALRKSLPPVIDQTTEYLVLGTIPGEQSLLHQQYYNNPRNQFWKIIAEAFNNKKPFTDYNDKLKTLKYNKIGLWDVLDTCDREGSSDSNIKNPTINNFDKLFKDFPKIKTVIFNGQDSYDYFISLFDNKNDKIYLRLSSTSSANGHKTLSEKTQEWKTAMTKKNSS